MRFISLATIALALSSGASAQDSSNVYTIHDAAELDNSEETLAYSKAGPWHVRVDLTLAGSCFAFGPFNDGTAVRFQMNQRDGELMLMVGNNYWRSVTATTRRKLEIGFGENDPWSAEAVGSVTGGMHWLTVTITDGAFINEFRKSRWFTMNSGAVDLGSFVYTGASAAMDKLVECQNFTDSAVDPFAEKPAKKVEGH